MDNPPGNDARHTPKAAGPRRDSGPSRRAPRRRRPIPEAVLHTAWRTARTVEGRKGDVYRVLYSGTPGGSSGPDFRNAVIETPSGALVRGDVEIHVHRSGWFAHGHHRDPAYNGVVFHVAADHAGSDRDGGSVPSASGLAIPLLLLKSRGRRGVPAPAASLSLAGAPRISLAEAGDRRFFARSSGLEILHGSLTPDELLWREIMECAGYSANRKPFRELAKLVPWSSFATIAPAASLQAVESVLLWAGGFAERPAIAGLQPLSGRRPAWAAHPGRPDNRPERRIRGIARLAAGWRSQGGPARALQQLVAEAGAPAQLIAALTVPGPAGKRALIGEGRAREIAVNAVLPAVHAIARREGRWHVYERSFALFRAHPKTPENSVTKEMRRLLANRGAPEPVQGAREQQGLIYLYRSMTNPAIA